MNKEKLFMLVGNSISLSAGLRSSGRKTPPKTGGQDAILANSDRYDPARMEQYRKIRQYAETHGVSFEEAIEEVKDDAILANSAKYDPARMELYRKIRNNADQYGLSFADAALAVCG